MFDPHGAKLSQPDKPTDLMTAWMAVIQKVYAGGHRAPRPLHDVRSRRQRAMREGSHVATLKVEHIHLDGGLTRKCEAYAHRT